MPYKKLTIGRCLLGCISYGIFLVCSSVIIGDSFSQDASPLAGFGTPILLSAAALPISFVMFASTISVRLIHGVWVCHTGCASISGTIIGIALICIFINDWELDRPVNDRWLTVPQIIYPIVIGLPPICSAVLFDTSEALSKALVKWAIHIGNDS